MKNQSLYLWLVLYHLDELPNSRLALLASQFDSPEALIAAGDLLKASGLKTQQVHAITHSADNAASGQKAEQAMAWLQASPHHHILPITDPCYPPLLRKIEDPPALLFVRGRLEALLQPQIAIVGSRRCSVDGTTNTRSFAQALAKQGFSICSGMARGIDTAAHEAALDEGGTTVAVMGTGADQCYPPQNKRLAQRLCEQGALITELPLGSGAVSSHFPKRNRIISGMSLGVIVIEAALKSGSLITARMAIEQNRELFAVPGSIRNPLSAGGHQLIQQGATLADSPQIVRAQLESLLDLQVEQLQRVPATSEVPDVDNPSDSMDERSLLAAMGFDPVSLEELVNRLQWPLAQVQGLLLELELNERIVKSGSHYVLS